MQRSVELLKERFGHTLLARMPLVPESTSQVCKTCDVIKALERTLRAAGVVTHNSAGSRLFVGHSFRCPSTGCFLDSNFCKIMVHARLSGETVLRYVREAPFGTHGGRGVGIGGARRSLVQTIQRLEATVCVFAGQLQTQVQAIRVGIKSYVWISSRASLTSILTTLPFVEMRVIARCDRGQRKVHFGAAVPEGQPPSAWRCFLDLGAEHALRVFSIDTSCAKCFGPSEQDVYALGDASAKAAGARTTRTVEARLVECQARCAGGPHLVKESCRVAQLLELSMTAGEDQRDDRTYGTSGPYSLVQSVQGGRAPR